MGNAKTEAKKRNRANRIAAGQPPRARKGRLNPIVQNSQPWPKQRVPVGLSVNSTSNRKRRVTRAQRRSRRGYRVTNGNSTIPEYPLCCIDPFSIDALGCKLPDPDTNMSGTFQVRTTYNMTFDAHGIATNVFWPDPACLVINTATTTAPNTWTWATNYTGQNPYVQLGALQGIYSSCRMISGGITVRYYGPTTGQGEVYVAPVFIDASLAGTTGFNGTLPLGIPDVTTHPDLITEPVLTLIDNEIMCLFEKTSPNANDYRSLQSGWINTAYQSGIENIIGINGIIVAAVAGPTSGTAPALVVEMCINYEGLPVSHSTSALNLVSPPAASRPIVIAAAGNLLNSIPPGRVVDGGGINEENFITKVEGAWNQAVKIAGTAADIVGTIASVGALLL